MPIVWPFEVICNNDEGFITRFRIKNEVLHVYMERNKTVNFFLAVQIRKNMISLGVTK